MWTQVTGMFVKRFKKEEDGALLVFFAMCCAAIFLIAALSFDIGRRASTQTELQSFVDNVALAAAGELNGFPGAIQRAQNAAQDLIQDEFVIGVGDKDLQGPGDYHIYFYSTLPDDDETAMPTTFENGLLDPAVASHDQLARFVRVAMINDPALGDKRVTVPWVFGRVLSIFSSDALPAEEVEAEAVAGFTSLACDVTPIFFCMPPTVEGTDPWDPEDNIGQVIRLIAEAGTGGGDWHPGNFAWLDVLDQVPAEDLTDPDGPCFGKNGPDLYACMVAGAGAVSLCFENGYLKTLTGRAEGWRPTTLNSFFDMYDAAQMDLEDDPLYPPAPVVTKDYVDGTTCGDGSSSTTTTTTMPLPPDDCYVYGGGSCSVYESEIRYGDAIWDTGRLEYVETNYATDHLTVADYLTDPDETYTVVGTNAGTYHVDDPFRPDPLNPSSPAVAGNPLVPAGSTRWDYYQAEVALSLYSNPGAFYAGTASGTPHSSPVDLIQDVYDPGPDGELGNGNDILVHDRLGSSLPSCSTDEGGASLASDDPRRRVVTAAAVDCETWRGEFNGRSGEFLAQYFVDIFLLNPARPNGSTRELYGEVISGALNGGNDDIAPGSFRNLVQLYR